MFSGLTAGMHAAEGARSIPLKGCVTAAPWLLKLCARRAHAMHLRVRLQLRRSLSYDIIRQQSIMLVSKLVAQAWADAHKACHEQNLAAHHHSHWYVIADLCVGADGPSHRHH